MNFSPVFIFMNPQMGENIGASARALKNCGLSSMRLVKPPMPWPENPGAQSLATGASDLLNQSQIFENLSQAVSDLRLVLATTARPRHMVKPVYTLEAAIPILTKSQEPYGILFGPESTGLHNEDLCYTHGLIQIPLNPQFSSLNLSQAVLLVAYEWWRYHQNQSQISNPPLIQPRSATGQQIQELFGHLENALDSSGFLHPPALRPTMLRNLKNLFLRAHMTEQEVRTLRGAIASFQHGSRNPNPLNMSLYN